MSTEISEATSGESFAFLEGDSNEDQAKTVYGRANHSAHFYGSSISSCSNIESQKELQSNIDKEAQIQSEVSKKNISSNKDFQATLILCLFGGNIGLHQFYAGNILKGIFMCVTLGGLGLWSVYDLITIMTGNFKDSEGKPINNVKF